MECKNCGYQFVPTLQKGFNEQTKLTACLLYINGLSLRAIACLLHTSAKCTKLGKKICTRKL